ncbi:tetratricopeptide repeat protein [Thermus filiformis]|uniref:Tetratricopeptide repeat protein n=1 Tax=Thermus filiformis TaxID=276 RepID=A0A0A2WSL5_THEFI|nr:tetratricopeptide repeat protein [Thermus filiformis]KGQ22813.1 tetratricopeptide repeat protein [Thermus filiformis]
MIPRYLAFTLAFGLALAASLEEAQAALEKGAYDRAAALFEEALAQDYARPEAHLGLGVALVRLGRLEEARFAFAQMALLFPNRPEGFYNLGLVDLRLGRLEEAAEALSKALDLAPTEEVYLALAEAQRGLGKAKEAAETLKKGLSPERSLRYRLVLAQTLLEAGQNAEAVPVLYEVLNRAPKEAQAWDLLAQILAKEGLKARALRELDRGLAQVEGKGRALLLYRKGLLSGEDRPLQEALAQDPGFWPAAYLLGKRRLEAKDPRAALPFLLQAYRAAQEPEVALALAAAQLSLGDAASAYAYAKEAGPPGVLLQAQAAYRLGRLAEAERLLQDRLEPEARALLGQVYLDQGRPEKAVEVLQPLYLEGRAPEVGANLAAAYLALGRPSDAELLLREVLERSSRLAPAWYNLGIALRALGREEEAVRAWKRAAELGYAPARSLLR